MRTEHIFINLSCVRTKGEVCPASILYKSIAGRYRPVSYPDGPITARYKFIKNAYWDLTKLPNAILLRTKILRITHLYLMQYNVICAMFFFHTFPYICENQYLEGLFDTV